MTQRPLYNRLPQQEIAGDAGDSAKKARAERIEQISNKIHAFFWVLLAGVTLFLGNVVEVALYDEKVNRICLNLALTLLFANVCIMLYLVVWLPYVKRISIPNEIYCPNMIPIATAFGVLSYILFVISFWPVWGLLSPLIVTIELFGLIFVCHFIPFCC